MYVNTLGFVLRETPYMESSKMLTVLTASEGKISVSARGAVRKGSKIAAASQLLALSEMTLLQSRGKWTLTEARSVELFRGVRDDLEKLALCSYFAELLEAVADEDSPNPQLMSLGLNAVYAVSEGRRPDGLIKAAFELRLMCLAGFEPMTDACGVCLREDVDRPYFDLNGGVVMCTPCMSGFSDGKIKISAGALDAMRHICRCDPKKLFS
ncbi:MAG: DNA repair protein RecO, partial [Oscillospiraceae bacterium]|nr:DNA repair protein RecO [Oscillospiraceae bacterium]